MSKRLDPVLRKKLPILKCGIRTIGEFFLTELAQSQITEIMMNI